jgi:hypothetical protein
MESYTLLGHDYEIRQFCYGQSKRLQKLMRSDDVQYPLLYAELPDYEYEDRGDNVIQFINIGFVVLIATAEDDDALQDDAIDLAIRIAERIIKVFIESRELNMPDTITVEPVIAAFSDNTYGARVTFKLKNQETDFLAQ